MAFPFQTLRRSLPLILLLMAGNAQADAGKDLFASKCTACHTIGGGDGAGPDLKGVGDRRTGDWLLRIITEPDQLSAQKDPTQLELSKKFGMEMPNLGISRDDASQIVAFLKAGTSKPAASEAASPAPTAPAPATGSTQPETVPTRELLSTGRALFTGQVPFAKGGPPASPVTPFAIPG